MFIYSYIYRCSCPGAPGRRARWADPLVVVLILYYCYYMLINCYIVILCLIVYYCYYC